MLSKQPKPATLADCRRLAKLCLDSAHVSVMRAEPGVWVGRATCFGSVRSVVVAAPTRREATQILHGALTALAGVS